MSVPVSMGIPIESHDPLPSYDGISRGDQIGLVFTASRFVQSWVPAKVLLVGEDDGCRAIAIEYPDGTNDLLHEDSDSIIRWPI